MPSPLPTSPKEKHLMGESVKRESTPVGVAVAQEDRPVPYSVAWRDQYKIVEARSPRQAIGVAIPEWDCGPLPVVTVERLYRAGEEVPSNSVVPQDDAPAVEVSDG